MWQQDLLVEEAGGSSNSQMHRSPNNLCFAWKLQTGWEHTLKHLYEELFILFSYF